MQTIKEPKHPSQLKSPILSSLPSLQRSPNPSISNDQEPIFESYLPVTAILAHENEDKTTTSKENLMFCYRAVLQTIDSLIEGKYTNFDAHTTTNCCHGIAILARSLILILSNLDMHQLRKEGVLKIQSLDKTIGNGQSFCEWFVPRALSELCCLYLLAVVKEIVPERGGITVTKKLKLISPISNNFCNIIAHQLQKRFSNIVATSYSSHLEHVEKQIQINGVPVEMWGKYIQRQYLRTDKSGVLYASNLFSMQVSLAHLIKNKAKVALVNDLRTSSGQVKDRIVHIFEGDGKSSMTLLTSEEIQLLQFHHAEPIIIFGGCCYTDKFDKESLSLRLNPWLHKFAGLVLANDVFYPQFPRAHNDPEFNCSSIIPEERQLKFALAEHAKIHGVTNHDPSLFCLTHIYPASIGQVLKVLGSGRLDILPLSYIPSNTLLESSS